MVDMDNVEELCRYYKIQVGSAFIVREWETFVPRVQCITCLSVYMYICTMFPKE